MFLIVKKEQQGIGVDGSKGGWIAVQIFERTLTIKSYKHFSEVVRAYPKPRTMLVDIPIGLPYSKEEAERRPEKKVRIGLPGKASTVFTVPCMQAAIQENYAEANHCNKELLGKGISIQSYNIMKKSLEVNEILERYPSYISVIKEAHPEYQFAQFTEKKLPIKASKKTPEGMLERKALLMELLEQYIHIRTPLHTFDLFKKYPDDVLDATCLAIAATLGEKHAFKTIPYPSFQNEQGIPMEMTYYSLE